MELLYHEICAVQDEVSPIDIPACTPSSKHAQPPFRETTFLGRARAELLAVGIIRPVTGDAVLINKYLSHVSSVISQQLSPLSPSLLLAYTGHLSLLFC